MPAPSPAALLKAARALLAEACADPESRPDWRFVLALHAATEEGRSLNTAEAALIAALPERTAARYLEDYRQAGLAAADPGDRFRYRLTPKAAADAALWVEALAPTPARAAPPPPPQAPRRAPRGWQW
jgi:hypothetical protein